MERVAVLVDGDNIGADYAAKIEQVGQSLGRVDVMRVYINAANNSAWLSRNGYRVMHAGSGKNAADLLLAVDAMELALAKGITGFVIASSDSDFVHLAQRLREGGLKVVGVGESKAPMPFRAACTGFELVAHKAPAMPTAKPACAEGEPDSGPPVPPVSDMDQKIQQTIARHSTGGQGMKIVDLSVSMRKSHDIKISACPEKTWRGYLSRRSALYELDPKGPNAKVRFKPAGFACPLRSERGGTARQNSAG